MRTKCSLYQCLTDHLTTSHHMPKTSKARRGSTVPSPTAWSSTKKSEGTKKFVMTGSVDGCSILSETQFVGTRLHVDTTQVLSVYHVLSGPEFDIKPSLGAPLLIFFVEVISRNLFNKGILLQDSRRLK